jgi:hypothetical protein
MIVSQQVNGFPRQLVVMMTEETMLNLIPFAGARWKMTEMEGQSGLIGKFLQFELPESVAVAIAAPTVSGNHQMLTARILNLSSLLPPALNGFNRKLNGIVFNPHIHPTLVLSEVIDAIGNHRSIRI